MDLLKIMENRRSVRNYTGEAVPDDKLDKILKAGLLSASSRGRKPWEFIVVENKDTLLKLSKCRVGSAKMLEGADCAVVVIANSDLTDVWVEDCSIAMSNMHLMADSLDVGSCWIQGRLREAENGETTESYLRSILGFPENYKLEAILSLGMTDNHPAPHSSDELLFEKIHKESF